MKRRQTSDYDVFLSHSSKDKRLASLLEKRLDGAGAAVWIDHANIRAGGLLLDALQDALSRSARLVLLWSKAAAKSNYVSAEWQAAWHLQKGIIPCRLDATKLPPFLLRYRYCDFQESYESGAAELVGAVTGRSAGRPWRASRPGKGSTRPPKPAKKVAEMVQELYDGQEFVMICLQGRKPQFARSIQSRLEPIVTRALKAAPEDVTVLNLAGYHKKNAFMIQRDEQPARSPPARLLEEAEKKFFDALSVRPNDPSALNGLGSVLILRGELDAAEFFVQRALAKAKEDNVPYAAAEHDLNLIQTLKQQRT